MNIRKGRGPAWQQVVESRRLWLKGEGWWEIWLACGHGGEVLHGETNPLGERCKFFHKCLTAHPETREEAR